jgi:hypothetical protein
LLASRCQGGGRCRALAPFVPQSTQQSQLRRALLPPQYPLGALAAQSAEMPDGGLTLALREYQRAPPLPREMAHRRKGRCRPFCLDHRHAHRTASAIRPCGAPRAPGAIDAVTKLPPPARLRTGKRGSWGGAESAHGEEARRHRGRHLMGAKTPGGNDRCSIRPPNCQTTRW